MEFPVLITTAVYILVILTVVYTIMKISTRFGSGATVFLDRSGKILREEVFEVVGVINYDVAESSQLK